MKSGFRTMTDNPESRGSRKRSRRNLIIGASMLLFVVLLFDLASYRVSMWLLDRYSSVASDKEYFERSRRFIRLHPYRNFQSPFQELSVEQHLGRVTLIAVERDPQEYDAFRDWLDEFEHVRITR